jgi:hypothetical protein
MSVLSRQKNGTAVIVRNTKIPLCEGVGNRARGRITALATQNTSSLPRTHKKKVLAVRQQLAEGRYDLDKRLDATLDRLLESLIT